MEYSRAEGGKLIHEKTRSKKSRDTVPLSLLTSKATDMVVNCIRILSFIKK
jgi:hypothetical protein